MALKGKQLLLESHSCGNTLYWNILQLKDFFSEKLNLVIQITVPKGEGKEAFYLQEQL